MSTNSVKNTDFLNNKSIEIKDGDYVFIKPINIRNNLYYLQYKDFKNKIKDIESFKNVEKKSPKPNSKEAISIFEIFTLDETKYKNQCKSDKDPFSIDEVAKYKGLYSIEKGKNPDITGTHKQINTNQSNVYVTFDNGIVSKVSDVIKYTPTQIHNTLTNDHRQINQQNNQQNNQPFTEYFLTDTELQSYLKGRGYNHDKANLILRNFSTLDKDTQDKVKKIVITNNEALDNNKRLNADTKKQQLLNLLSSADTNSIKDKILKLIKTENKGGKATRRRQRKGKKRSKNTRKKRKSKKQRRQ